MHTKRFLAALLASVMLISAMAACSEGGDDTPAGDDTSASADTTAAETEPKETGRAGIKDNLPADFTMDGKTVGVYMRSSVRKIDWDGGGEESGDVIYDAVYQRTRNVEDRLKTKFEVTEISGTWQEFGTTMEQNILAGDNIWQIVLTTGNAAISSSRDYLFQDVSQNKYLDFDQPWWWKTAMEELSLDGKRIRYMVGDISLMNYTKAGAMFFNKDLLEANGYKADDLYKTVIDRKWTYSLLREMCQAVYSDLNGDGEVNEGDRYGLYVNNPEFVYHMEYSIDIRRITRDSNGYPVMDFDIDRSTKAVDVLNDLLHNTKGVGYMDDKVTVKAAFNEGTMVFMAEQLLAATTAKLREMEADYGIIPYPMLDETQKEYTNVIHNSSDFVTIPITCPNPDEIGAVIEALCSESYRTVVEPFYESALKSKYSRDSYSGQCIDIIRDVSVKQFLFDYTGTVKGGTMVGAEVRKNQNNFASSYAKQVDTTNKNIQNLIDKYIKAEEDLK